MTNIQAYIARETAVSALINAMLTVAFFLSAFHGQARPEVWGAHGVVVDCLPQGFMVGLMSVVPAMLLTRKRLRSGQIASLSAPGQRPAPAAARAIICAVASMIGLTLAAAGAAKITGAHDIPVGAALGLKVAASLLISSLTTPGAVRAALTSAS